MSFFDDIGDAVSSAAGAVGDAVEGAVGAVGDAIEDVVDGAADGIEVILDAIVAWSKDNLGGFLGTVVAVFAGVVRGIVEAFRAIAHDMVTIVRDLGHFFSAVVHLDIPGAVSAFSNIFINAIDLTIDVFRVAVGGYIVGGIKTQLEKDSLRTFVRSLISERYKSSPAVRDRILGKLHIGSGKWGLRVNARHVVLMLDSKNVPLWQWHQDRTIDLYAAAGLLSFNSFQIQRPRTWVRQVGSDGKDTIWPINRWIISDYLQSQGRNQRLRVYAMDMQAVRERIDCATTKCKRLGIYLNWDQKTGVTEREILAQEITRKDDYAFDVDSQEQFPGRMGLRKPDRSEECVPLGIGVFQYKKGSDAFGRTAHRNIAQGKASTPCSNIGRDDGCCITISAPTPTDTSSVTHRDVWPSYIFRYVLAHELGHYFGLCHYGHSGVENIMYTIHDDKAELSPVSFGTLGIYYQGEPEFTLSDGKNAWRFIVDQMQCCLDPTLICGVQVQSTSSAATLREEVTL